MNIKKKIHDLISMYENRIEVLKNLEISIESDPGLTSEVINIFGSNNLSVTNKQNSKKAKKANQYDKILEIMKDGHWRTAQEIADEMKAKKSSIAPYFYYPETKGRFEKRNHPKKPGTKQWRLKKEQKSTVLNESIN